MSARCKHGHGALLLGLYCGKVRWFTDGHVTLTLHASVRTLFYGQPMGTWTPTPLLLEGPPFPYPGVPISTKSNTQAFNTGIDKRDGERCIVCGSYDNLEHCHIVPKVEGRRVRSYVYSICLPTLMQLHSVEVHGRQWPYPFAMQDRCP
jgi:hypothetical protein